MSTQPQEFIDLAAELIGDEFAAFATDAVIAQDQGFDYDTQQPLQRTQSKPMIQLEYKETQFNDQMIKAGDYMLIGQYQNFEWDPSPDNTTVTHGGKVGAVKWIDIDPAKATIIIHMRRS